MKRNLILAFVFMGLTGCADDGSRVRIARTSQADGSVVYSDKGRWYNYDSRGNVWGLYGDHGPTWFTPRAGDSCHIEEGVR